MSNLCIDTYVSLATAGLRNATHFEHSFISCLPPFSLNLQSLADIREILWSPQCFPLPPKTAVDKRGEGGGGWYQRRASQLFVCVGPPGRSHTVRDNVPNGWPAARNTKKPSSSVVWAPAGVRAGGWGWLLVYIEIKAEKWETAVYIFRRTVLSISIHTQTQAKARSYEKCGFPMAVQMRNRAPTRFDLQVRTAGLTVSHLQHNVYTI